MKSAWTGFHSPLAPGIDAFLAHKRALGCLFRVEELSLRLFDRFLIAQPITTLTRSRPTSWTPSSSRAPDTRRAVITTCAGHSSGCSTGSRRTTSSGPRPCGRRPRRSTQSRLPFLFDDATARRLLDTASQLPDKGGTVGRGATYRVIFTVLYGLGLRVGEVARLCVGDVDLDPRSAGHPTDQVLQEPPRPLWSSHPHGVERSPRPSGAAGRDDPRLRPRCSRSAAAGPSVPGPSVKPFTISCRSSGFRFQTGPSAPACMTSGTRLRWARCCAGTGAGSTPARACSSCRRSSATSVP